MHLRAWNRAVMIGVALTAGAAASPRAQRRASSARSTVEAAQSECAHPGGRLATLVAKTFDPDGFGSTFVTDWKAVTEAQRAAFAALADDVIGAPERAAVVHALCAEVIDSVSVADDASRAWIKLHHPSSSAECDSMIFEYDGQRWQYSHTWFCGKSLYGERWRRDLGGEQGRAPGYETAMAHLQAIAATRADR